MSRIPEQLRQRFSKLGGVLGSTLSDDASTEAVFSLGRQVNAALPRRGLPYGVVTELQSQGLCGVGTSFALHACQSIQRGSEPPSATEKNRVSATPWCAYLDPSSSLFAPGACQLGVELRRLLVVRPQSEEALARSAVHIAKSGLISLLVVDTRWGLSSNSSSRRRSFFNQRLWRQTVRRLSLAVQRKKTCVLLLTETSSLHGESLPVALRLRLSMHSPDQLSIQVAKERTGIEAAATVVAWRSSLLSSLDPFSSERQ